MTDGARRGWVIALVCALVVASGAMSLLIPPPVRGGNESSPAAPPPPTENLPRVNFTLHGDAGLGWGFSDTNITQPGPRLTVHVGDVVNLTLIAADSNPHNWFIDYDNSLGPNGDEPNSPDFDSSTVLVFEFVADRPGNWTYLCRFHTSSMKGTIEVLSPPRPVNITLYGDAALGWGFSSSTIREPGPQLTVFWGTNVTLTLIAADSNPHTWFIDYDNSLAPSGDEPRSGQFGPANTMIWSFVADQTGDWTYRCGVHPTSMTGTILIVGGPPPQLPRGAIPLISAIMLATLGLVLIFAVVYHFRAVRAAKRMK